MVHDDVTAAVADGAVLVDGRFGEDFAAGHLPNAINVGLDGRYAEIAGSVIPPEAAIVLSRTPARSWKARTGWPASASTG